MAGATDTRNNHKSGFAHPSMIADLVILDPALSVSTPERIWLSTGLRAVSIMFSQREGFHHSFFLANARIDRLLVLYAWVAIYRYQVLTTLWVDHCVEGLCSTSSNAGPETEKSFTEGLKLLVPNLLLTRQHWEDEEPRLKEMMGVIESMKGMKFGVPMGGSHGTSCSGVVFFKDTCYFAVQFASATRKLSSLIYKYWFRDPRIQA